MKTIYTIIRKSAILLLLIFMAVSSAMTVRADEEATSVYFVNGYLYLHPGETGKPEYGFYPEGSTGTISWSVDHTEDCPDFSIDENGNITANGGYGAAVINATLSNGYTEQYTLYIYDYPQNAYTERSKYYIQQGTTGGFALQMEPFSSYGCFKTVSSSDENVVKPDVYEYCGSNWVQLKGVGLGSAMVSVDLDHQFTSATEVEVVDWPLAESIDTAERTVLLTPGESVKLDYTLSPSNSQEEPVWNLSWVNNNCISLSDDGTVTANDIGSGYLYAQTQNGSTVSYTIYVSYNNPESIELGRDSIKVPLHSGKSIYFSTDPWESTYCRKHVTCDDPSVVSISEEWIYQPSLFIYGIKAGTSTVTVTADNGVSDSIVVEVVDGVFADSISSDETEVGLNIKDEPYQLKYELYPADSAEEPEFRLNWANNNCISVDSNGLVTPLGIGNASVIAEIANGNSIYYNIYVNGSDPTSIGFSYSSYVIAKDVSTWIGMNIQPYESSRYCRKHIVSSDPSVARVDEEWVYNDSFYVYGESEGTATITVTTDNGLTAQMEVTVKDGIANSIWATDSEYYYVHPNEGVQLEYSLSPDTATEKPTWSVSYDPSGCVASISEDGYLTASGKTGTATVMATIEKGSSAYYYIYVAEDPVSMRFKRDGYRIISGRESDLSNELILSPGTAMNADYSVSSDNSNVCEIHNYGKSNSVRIYGRNAGTATITATSATGVTASATITVLDGYASNISAVNQNVTLQPGESEKLEYTLTPENPANEEVTFEIVAGDDLISFENGTVTALKPGQAIIAARTSAFYDSELNYGSIWGYYATYTINISTPPNDLHFNQEVYTLKKNDRVIVKALSDSSDADYSAMSFSSSDPSVVRITKYSYTDQLAMVQTISAGTATITAVAENGVTATATVVVEDDEYSNEYIYLDLSDYGGAVPAGTTINIADHAYTDYSLQTPADISKYTFMSTDPAVINVENGIITAVAAGSAFVYVKGPKGETMSTLSFRVYGQIDSVRFAQSEYTLEKGDSLRLREILKIEPEMYPVSNVEFRTGNESVISIGDSGQQYYEAFATGIGDTTVTAISPDGKTAQTVIHVVESYPYTEINLDEELPLVLHKNYLKQLKINSPSTNGVNSYWLKSSDERIVKISNSQL